MRHVNSSGAGGTTMPSVGIAGESGGLRLLASITLVTSSPQTTASWDETAANRIMMSRDGDVILSKLVLFLFLIT